MRFKDRKELADKYKEWVKQSIDNNQTMILDCAESVIAFLDINGYLKQGEKMSKLFKLKSCPFCGGFAGVIKDTYDTHYMIHCNNCDAKTKTFMQEEKAVEAWNRRVNDEHID